MADPDAIDGFEDIWGALEALNPLLQAKYSLETKFVVGKCKSCNAPIEVVGSSSGIKHALLNLAGFSADIWKQARSLRKDIVHGVATHDSVVGRIPGVLPALSRALTAAILDLIEATNVSLADFTRLPMNPRVPAEAFFGASIKGWQPPPSVRIEDLPFVEVTLNERDRAGDFGAPGTKTVTFDLTYTARNLIGTMSDLSMELFVTKDPEDTSATLSQSGFSIKRSEA